MCPDLFSEEAPCGLILVSDHLRKATKSFACILGDRSREVRLHVKKFIFLGDILYNNKLFLIVSRIFYPF